MFEHRIKNLIEVTIKNKFKKQIINTKDVFLFIKNFKDEKEKKEIEFEKKRKKKILLKKFKMK